MFRIPLCRPEVCDARRKGGAVNDFQKFLCHVSSRQRVSEPTGRAYFTTRKRDSGETHPKA